jgi:beta-glucanase (GH16 family)
VAGGTWRLAWSDEFDGPAGQMAADAKWKYERGCGWGDGEEQCYTRGPNNAVLDGTGNLVVTARKEDTASAGTTFHYTSARLNTIDRYSFTYGRLEARIRVPAGRGLWPAFWAMGRDQFLPDGSSNWPDNGEIGIMELLGHDPATVEAHIHGPTAENAPNGWQYGGGFKQPTALSATFHTYGLVWSADAVEWQLDGRTYYRFARTELRPNEKWVFDGPFNVLLNLAVGGVWPGSPDATTPFPSSMVVDWVRVSQLG